MPRSPSKPKPRPTPAKPSPLEAVLPKIAAATIRPAQLLALQAFDVAARAGSFKAAAQSLNLTPSAISHRIRNLEASLGAALFTRTHRAVELNAEGRRLAAATGKAFAELARVGAPMPDRSRRLRLRLKVLPTFASSWLIPRMADFINRHPDVDVAIETSSRNVDFDTEAFDAGISVGNADDFGTLAVDHLTDISTTPVASPELIRRLRLRRPDDLARAVLIEVTTFPAAWRLWLKHAGVADLKPKRTISVDSFVASMQAAEQGAGVALGLEPFVIARERAGAIARPLGLAYPTGSYWLVAPKGQRRNRALEAFRRWLLSALKT
jgi:DNA-binding transcriptional LysR family regulator